MLPLGAWNVMDWSTGRDRSSAGFRGGRFLSLAA